jgi:hypothetical protein
LIGIFPSLTYFPPLRLTFNGSQFFYFRRITDNDIHLAFLRLTGMGDTSEEKSRTMQQSMIFSSSEVSHHWLKFLFQQLRNDHIIP